MASVYKTLPHAHTRLLVNVPGAGDRDLRFNFLSVVPSQAPAYTAVSYAWGHEKATETIYVDSNPVLIRPNLWACLHSLRRTWTYIWADAVCINQNDTIEKNRQVSMMEKIYSKATVVSVWLGLVPLPVGMSWPDRIVTLEVDDFDWRENLLDIASRPYWSRAWVIQEFLLARDIHLHCSNTRIDDLFFQDLLSNESGLNLLQVHETTDLVARSDLMRKWPALAIMFHRHVDRYPSYSRSLYELLLTYTYTESTDPRDRVFALLGLLGSEERGALQRCFPDYSLSEEIVKAVTLGHLKVFASGLPLEPVYEALRIKSQHEISRLQWVTDAHDYIGSDNPAKSIEWWMNFQSEICESREGPPRTYGTINQEWSTEWQALSQIFQPEGDHRVARTKWKSKTVTFIVVVGLCASLSFWIKSKRDSGD